MALRNTLLWMALLTPSIGLTLEPSAPVTSSNRPKNIIIMINDGSSWGTWQAASYWEFGALGRQIYDAFPVKLGVTTFPLVASEVPTFSAEQKQSYQPAKAWGSQRAKGALPFTGYEYLAQGVTDSAAAATAMASGQKTHNSAINTDNFGKPIPFITELAKAEGKATGVVTTVPFSHATPAAFSTHSLSRLSYPAIAHQMLTEGTLDLIIGAGSPDFDREGIECDAPNARKDSRDCAEKNRYFYIGEQDWQQLKQQRLKASKASQPWHLLETLPEVEALIRDDFAVDAPIILVPQVRGSLQVERSLAVQGRNPNNPSGINFIAGMPKLADLSEAALNYLSQKSGQGLFVMIEGGATDWAAHVSGPAAIEPKYGQLIEETVDFNQAVRAVVNWVERDSSWDETLLIVTSDHGNGMVLGPQASKQAFQPVQNRGAGKLPGLSLQPLKEHHSNELVLLWAKGAGAELLAASPDGRDLGFQQYVGHNDGSYIDNTRIGKVMAELVKPAAVVPAD